MNEITTEDLTQRLASGEKIKVIDIREENEYADWHIYGSENKPMFKALAMGNTSIVEQTCKDIPNDSLVVAVCRMGNTSKFAVNALSEMGFDAASLIGGIHGWTNSWTEAPVEAPGVSASTFLQIRRNGKGCLSYLIGSKGVGAVVDPCMDESIYVSIAEREKLNITHVIETHVHADHISRARKLCEATGATLMIPKNDRTHFDYVALNHGQSIEVGDTTLRVLVTPGHTMESACYDVDGKVLLSGDTVFVESIGRPDLEKGDAGAQVGAELLFDSLHKTVLELDDDILVCPGHTSEPIGFDGKTLCRKLGDIKKAVDLLDLEKEPFVARILEGLGKKPPNFNRVLAVNEGREDLNWLDPLELEAGPNRCAVK